jgi:membrane protease YdiL (CAAX protease family)
MENQQSAETSPAPTTHDTLRGGLITQIFRNAEGLRAGWRLLLYVGFVAIIFFVLKTISTAIWKSTPGVFSYESIFLSEVIGFVSAFGAAVAMSFVERRPIGLYGLPLRRAFGRLFWQGCFFGILEISLLIGVISVFHGYSFGPLALHGAEIMHWAVLWALCLLFVGLFEEFLFRGYSLFTLASGIGFWPAAILLSLLFGAVHLQNSGEGRIGVAAVFVVGMLWCFSIRRTGSLWFAVGMHAAFDFGETFLYSVPDSGMVLPGHLSSATMQGPAWLTGGSVGPEASVFDFLLLFILFYVIHRLYPVNPSPHHNEPGAYSTSSDANTSFTP